MPNTLSPPISQKFKFWSFISMLLLVFVHGYNLNQRYLQPFTVVEEPMTITAYLEYFFANGIFRFRIPMLFIISGFLYAMYDEKPYVERIKKRSRTLIVPYLMWSAIGLLLTFGLECFPFGKSMVGNTHLLQIDETRIYLHQYKWYEWLFRWIIYPVPYQLWFLRVLFIYNLMYPAIKWSVTHRWFKWVYFGLVFLLWLSTIGLLFIEGEGLLFFSIGVFIQKTNFNIERPSKYLRPVFWGLVFIVFSTVKTWLAFKGYAIMGDGVFPTLLLMHKLVIFAGLIAAWFGGDALVKWAMNKGWFVQLSAFSFIIYAMHVPLLTYVIDPVFELVKNLPNYRMLTFIFLPIVIIACCIALGFFLRKFIPKIYGVLTGGRGL